MAGGSQYPQRPRTGRAVRDDRFVKRPNQRELEELAAKVLGPATTLQIHNDNELADGGSRSATERDLLERIEQHLSVRTEQDSSSELKNALAEEWRLVAYVVDRLSGVVFFVVTIIFNLVILLSSPEVSKFEYCRGPPGSCN